jgi:hypothetical protein
MEGPGIRTINNGSGKAKSYGSPHGSGTLLGKGDGGGEGIGVRLELAYLGKHTMHSLAAPSCQTFDQYR